jgi:5'-3' exonuclease
MKIHLVDGTYELFRAHYGAPPARSPDGRSVGATRGLIQTLLLLLRERNVTHVAVAFDQVVESFRNDLFAGYKTGDGVPADIMSQFGLAEEASAALGLVVWPMVEFEADDALASAAHEWCDAVEVDQIVICSPDKDLTQIVRDERVVCLDRRKGATLDETAVEAKFGVPPGSIPDYLALVGDAADGIPGVPRWGAKTSAALLARYGHVEEIPEDPSCWDVTVRGAGSLAASLAQHRDDAALYKRLATLRTDVPIEETIGDLEWRGAPRARFHALCEELGFDRLADAPHRWADE